MTPTPQPTSDTEALITTCAQKIQQVKSIEQQAAQYQNTLTAWAAQRDQLVAEIGQLKDAIKAGTAWPAPAPATTTPAPDAAAQQQF